jgi:hypothetical protein
LLNFWKQKVKNLPYWIVPASLKVFKNVQTLKKSLFFNSWGKKTWCAGMPASLKVFKNVQTLKKSLFFNSWGKKTWCASMARVNYPHIANQLTLTIFCLSCSSCDAQPNFRTVRRLLCRNLYGRYPKDFKFSNSEYEVHQVEPKDYGSPKFLLAFRDWSSVETNFCNDNGAWQTDFFYRTNHVI